MVISVTRLSYSKNKIQSKTKKTNTSAAEKEKEGLIHMIRHFQSCFMCAEDFKIKYR